MTQNSFIILIIIATSILSSCSTHRSSKSLLQDAERAISKKYKTGNARVILQYDLNNPRNTCLHSHNYLRLINDLGYNKKFTPNINLSRKNVTLTAQKKLTHMHKLAYSLKQKYRIPLRLTKIDGVTRSKNSKSNAAAARASVARLSFYSRQFENIPVFVPEYHPKTTSPFGKRVHPITNKVTMHKGLDLVTTPGGTVAAAANGRVSFAGQKNGYGNIVIINHKYKLQTKYAHLRRIYVKTGEQVIAGQRIGLQGRSGKVTAEHLHFEILLNKKPVNPMDFINLDLNCK